MIVDSDEIVVGVCRGPTGRFEEVSLPSLCKYLPNATILTRTNQSKIATAYNSIFDEAIQLDASWKFLILIHDDVEICGPLAKQLAKYSSLAELGLFGLIGGRGERRGSGWFSSPQRFGAMGPLLESNLGEDSVIEVDVLDGFLLGFTRNAAENLRFDEHSYLGFHGYDADVCSFARSLEIPVHVLSLDAIHRNNGFFSSAHSYKDWCRSNLVWRLKWAKIGTVHSAVLRIRIRLWKIEAILRPSIIRRTKSLRRTQSTA